MNNQDLLQQVLNVTLERFSKQTISYEAEIANLNAQIIVLKDQIAEMQNLQNNLKEDLDE